MIKPKSIDFKYNTKLYWTFLKKYKISFIFLMIFILIIEASHLFDNFLLKYLFDYGAEFSSGNITSTILLEIFLKIALIMVIVGISRAVLKFIHIHTINTIDAHLIKDVKAYFFKHIIRLSSNFHSTHKTGSLISRLVRSGGAVERMTDVLIFNFTPLFFKLIITLIIIAFFSLKVAFVIFIIAVLFIIYSFILQKIQEPHNIKANNAEDTDKAAIGDFFANIASIKNFGKEDQIIQKFGGLINISKDAVLQRWGLYRWIDFGQATILSLGTIFVLYMAILDFSKI